MNNLSGKVAVITGAGRGIGRGIAIRCAQEGMKVVLAGIGLESLTKTAADLEALGAETRIVQTDVSDRREVENLAEASFSTFGSVDLLVNNAGVVAPGSVLEISYDDWDWVMNVNFNGVLYGIKTFVPRLIEQTTPSHVVTVSSISGILPGYGSYSVSKHAVVVLHEALYNDLAEAAPHVKVSVYCPGWVDTEFYRVDQSRPERFSGEATPLSEERRVGLQKSLSKGYSIQESAEILFEGLANDRLYIGPRAFQAQLPGVADEVRERIENILNERNPKV